MVNGASPSRHSAGMRSRVTPGWSCTIAIFLPARRLNRADFPTLGRPTMATVRDMKDGAWRMQAVWRVTCDLLTHLVGPARFAVAGGMHLRKAAADVANPGNEAEDP